jgi:hypothetical protein
MPTMLSFEKEYARTMIHANLKGKGPESGESFTSAMDTSAGDGGYGDGSPDSSANYEYGDDGPDSSANYGYGDTRPDDVAKYGYGDESGGSSSRAPRRSSMKQSGRPRRASIQFGGEIEVHLLGKTKPVLRRTSISFDEKVKVESVTPVSALTDKPETLWFQEEEYKQIISKCYNLVEKVEQGLTGGKKYCIRGLESLMEPGSEQKEANRYIAWDSVLAEQDLQRRGGRFDDENMAKLYKLLTIESKMTAARLARQDAAEIENYLQKTRMSCRRLSM